MYQRILLPTDGSRLSREAVAGGIAFAREIGAAVFGCHVIALPGEDQLEAWTHHDPQYAQRRQALFEKFADTYLEHIAGCAHAQGVPHTCTKMHGQQPHRELLALASSTECDLIYMAAHGWTGDESRWPGNVTLQMLEHSMVPVLIHKPGRVPPPSAPA